MTGTSSFVPPFPVRDGSLCPGGVGLDRLLEKSGRSPFYVYDLSVMEARVACLRNELGPGIDLHYALKANPFGPVVKRLAALVDGADVASQGELETALTSGFAANRISFAGPGKRREELERAVTQGVLINVESPHELTVIGDISRQWEKPARVAFRVNPPFSIKQSGMKMGGGPKPFGIDSERVPDVLKALPEGVRFEGFHIFAGSQSLDVQALTELEDKSVDLAIQLGSHAPSGIRIVNIGGGFGIPYFPGEHRLDLVPLGANLRRLAEKLKSVFPAARLTIELGRFLVGECGVYLCRVVDRKVSRGEVFLVTDGGMHHHLAATGHFGQVIRKNFPVAIANKMDRLPEETVSIVGPLCTPMDLLADHVSLPRADVGDWVAVFQSGAYGFSASPTGFLSHPLAMEIAV